MTTNETEELKPGQVLLDWIAGDQVPARIIVGCLEWQEAICLSATSPAMYARVVWLVTAAQPAISCAVDPRTPEQLRLPSLVGQLASDPWVSRWEARDCMSEACSYGMLSVAQQIHRIYKFTKPEIQLEALDCMDYAEDGGHTEMVAWMREEFGKN